MKDNMDANTGIDIAMALIAFLMAINHWIELISLPRIDSIRSRKLVSQPKSIKLALASLAEGSHVL